MAEEEGKKKRGPPFEVLPNKQVMPMIGFGTAGLNDDRVIADILRKGLQIGYCKHLDTARLYNNEIALGKAVKTVIDEGRVKREEMFIASKIFNLSGESVQSEVKEMLQMMQLKYIDLLYLHWPSLETEQSGEFNHRAIEDVWADMELLVTKGYVRHLGVSNMNGQAIMDLLNYCKIKPVALQIQVHPYLPNTALVELAQKNGIHVLAYSPLMKGNNLNRGDNVNILTEDAINEVANKHGRTAAQVVLRTSLQKNIGVITKTTNLARLQENYESWSFDLGEDDWKKIRPLAKGYRICSGDTHFKSYSVFDY